MASIVRADPFTDLAASWQRDIDRMFRSLAESFGSGGTMARRSEWLPWADVLARGDDLVTRVELPGIDPDRDLEITIRTTCSTSAVSGRRHRRRRARGTSDGRRPGAVSGARGRSLAADSTGGPGPPGHHTIGRIGCVPLVSSSITSKSLDDRSWRSRRSRPSPIARSRRNRGRPGGRATDRCRRRPSRPRS